MIVFVIVLCGHLRICIICLCVLKIILHIWRQIAKHLEENLATNCEKFGGKFGNGLGRFEVVPNGQFKGACMSYDRGELGEKGANWATLMTQAN